MAPDGKNIYATRATGDAVVALTRNTSTGAITFLQHIQNTLYGLDGVSAVAVSPDNKQVYTVGKIDLALTQFDRNSTDGTLTSMRSRRTGRTWRSA